jgi:hypothetical protein
MQRQRILGPILSLLAGLPAAWAGPPSVSNVRVTQRATDSNFIDILYDLADADGNPCTVWLLASIDDGATWQIPIRTFEDGSAIGPSVLPAADRHIAWEAGADIPGLSGDIRVRVYADDGDSMANMVYVPAGPFPYQNTTMVEVDAFWIDKYEVTNLRYCEFLNSADPNGDHHDSHMEITKDGAVYSPFSGRENFPVNYVSWDDANAFAAWLSQRENRVYRLPTEYEWEKAAGWNPTSGIYYTYAIQNHPISCSFVNYKPNDYCVGDTVEVGTYPYASYYGCYDMSGNLFELTSSAYTRGGYYGSAYQQCRVDYRPSSGISTTYRGFAYGFRLVLEP